MIGAQDSSYFQERVAGAFVRRGVTSTGQDPATVAATHLQYVFGDEAALPVLGEGDRDAGC